MRDVIRCPSADAAPALLDSFGVSYDAYRRLAASPGQLAKVVAPVLDALRTGQPIPEWAGIDLLRGALFCVHRRGHHTGPSSGLERDFRVLIARIREIVGEEPLPRDHFG